MTVSQSISLTPTVTVPRQVRVFSFIGYSGAGKTMLIERLIRHRIATGHSVAVIKHTHHPVEGTNRGDTARFLRAGASVVILAGKGEAMLWRGSSHSKLTYREPTELLDSVHAEWVLIEGFKSRVLGPAVVLGQLEPPEHAVAVVTNRPAGALLPTFSSDQVAELAEFLDKITGS